MRLYKNKKLCVGKEAINKTKKQPIEWEKISANDILGCPKSPSGHFTEEPNEFFGQPNIIWKWKCYRSVVSNFLWTHGL